MPRSNACSAPFCAGQHFLIASRFGGAGLGLSSVKQLARAMGGDIVVTQRKGGGATLYAQCRCGEGRGRDTSRADGGARRRGCRSRCALGVKENWFGVVLNAILTELGHQQNPSGSGGAAAPQPARAQGALDAVLMDMVLPGIDGVEAIRRKMRALERRRSGGFPIICSMACREDEAVSRAPGADLFLVEPVSPRALATALHDATGHVAVATS